MCIRDRLYLIRKQNFNVLDIPMADVTRQYLSYVEMCIRDRVDGDDLVGPAGRDIGDDLALARRQGGQEAIEVGAGNVHGTALQ